MDDLKTSNDLKTSTNNDEYIPTVDDLKTSTTTADVPTILEIARSLNLWMRINGIEPLEYDNTDKSNKI